MNEIAPDIHPWIAVFNQKPDEEFQRLIAGQAAIYPYEPLDAADAAHVLFSPLPSDHPIRGTLSQAVMGWLRAQRKRSVPTDISARQRFIKDVSEAFGIIALLTLTDVAVQLRKEFNFWDEWVEGLVLTPARDVRIAYWRMLALTQDVVSEEDRSIRKDGLAPLWYQVCREAGSEYPEHYLSVGLLGLRTLPGKQNRFAWVAGLAQWALARRPKKQEFKLQWMALKALYPEMNKPKWRKIVKKILLSRSSQDERKNLAKLWAGDEELRNLLSGRQPVGGDLRSPLPEDCERVINQLHRPFAEVGREIDKLMDGHRKYVEATGDAQYFVRAIYILGKEMISKKGDFFSQRMQKLQALIREGLSWTPFNAYLWILWRKSFEALETPDALEAAELVGWEMVRRFPTESSLRNQLAQLLEKKGYPEKAEVLLRETIELFPDDIYARNQLAQLLEKRGFPEKAKVLLRETIKLFPDDIYARNQLAQLLEKKGFPEKAEVLLRETIELFPDDIYAPIQLANLLIKKDPVNNAREAEGLLQGVLQKDPDNKVAVSTLAKLITHHPSEKARRTALERSLQWLPKDEHVYNRLAKHLLDQSDDWELAEIPLKYILKENPENIFARNQLAKLLMKRGEDDDIIHAEELLRKTIELFPDDIYARNQLAQLLMSKGDDNSLEESKGLLEETIKLFPKNDVAYNLLADLLVSMGREKEEVMGLLRDAMAKVEKSEYVQERLAKLMIPSKIMGNAEEKDESCESEERQRIAPQEMEEDEEMIIYMDDIRPWAELRKLQFELEHAKDEDRERLKKELKSILDEDPHFPYAKLLAIRYGILQPDDMSCFAIAFEAALAEEDLEKLKELAKRFPKMQALIFVVRAALGDRWAQKQVDKWIEATLSAEENKFEGLHQNLRNMKYKDNKLDYEKEKETIITMTHLVTGSIIGRRVTPIHDYDIAA